MAPPAASEATGGDPMAVDAADESEAGKDGGDSGGDPAAGGGAGGHAGRRWTAGDDEHLREGEALHRICASVPLHADVNVPTDLVGNSVSLAAQGASAANKFGISTLVQLRSSDIANDFANPSLWTGSFPGLFVLGQGGLGQRFDDVVYHSGAGAFGDGNSGDEAVADLMAVVSARASGSDTGDQAGRRSVLSVELGARKLCTHYTQGFARHRHVLGMAFNVIQRKTACDKAQWYVAEDIDAGDLSKLNETINALKEGDPGERDEGLVRTLENLVSHVAGAVQGSDFGRKALAGNMMGNAMVWGANALFLTINFADLNDLRCYQEAERLHVVVTIAAKSGSKSNCVPFETGASWPDGATRIRTATSNPAAVATYFHESVKLYLAAFLQFPLSDGKGNKGIRASEGLFSFVESFAGTVETQLRGSLHLHMLMWLAGVRLDQLKAMLEDPQWRRSWFELVGSVASAELPKHLRREVVAAVDNADAGRVYSDVGGVTGSDTAGAGAGGGDGGADGSDVGKAVGSGGAPVEPVATSRCKCDELRAMNPKYKCHLCQGHDPGSKPAVEADVAANTQVRIKGRLAETLEECQGAALPAISECASVNPFASEPVRDETDGPEIAAGDQFALEQHYKAELERCYGFRVEGKKRGFNVVGAVESGTWAAENDVKVGSCLVGVSVEGAAEPFYTNELCALMELFREAVQGVEPRAVQLAFARAMDPVQVCWLQRGAYPSSVPNLFHRPHRSQCYSLPPDDPWDKDFDVRYALAVEGGRYIHRCGGKHSTCFKVG